MIRELGRLRELSFRAVGEGTMKARDLDQYDSYYRHIILWDDVEEDIVGSYRIGDAATILQRHQLDALYTHELFMFSGELIQQLQQGLELGRSFIQPKYWGKRSLDYLWQGIGAYLNANPQIRYLFGAVSISDDYPEPAKALLTHFYTTYFNDIPDFASARCPFQNTLTNPFAGINIDQDFKLLKKSLSDHDKTVPVLFKHYADFCTDGGVRFLAFNVDHSFNNCVDGFAIADLSQIKDKKYQRYIANHKPNIGLLSDSCKPVFR